MSYEHSSNSNYTTTSSTSINSNDGNNSNNSNNRFYEHRSHEQSSSTNTKPNQVLTTTATVIRQPQKNLSTLESESPSRPLSLYDNLSVLVASLKPPLHLSTTGSLVPLNNNNNFDQTQISNNNNGILIPDLNRRSNNGVENNLVNVRQEDFVFSDISFKFPELFGAVKSANNNNQNNNRINNRKSLSDAIHLFNNNDECLKKNLENMHSNSSINMNKLSNNQISNNITKNSSASAHQYVNIDDDSLLGNKPVISDAKSSFFGLKDRDQYDNNRDLTYQLNDSVTRPLLDQTLNDNTIVASSSNASQASTSSATSTFAIKTDHQYINISNDHKPNGDSIERKSRNGDTHTKTVSYITPEHTELLNKPSQVSFCFCFFNIFNSVFDFFFQLDL